MEPLRLIGSDRALVVLCRALNLTERLGMGPKLTPERMLKAYSVGLFPMGRSAASARVAWFYPDPRGVLPLETFHVPRRLARTIKSGRYRVTFDGNFAAALSGCAARSETWISPRIASLWLELHRLGYAHSVETWEEGSIVGGLYGVALGGAFFCESLFSHARDSSKVALVYLVDRLLQGGFTLFDTQFPSTHLAQFGATNIPRVEYRARLADAVSIAARFESALKGSAPSGSPRDLVGRLT